MARPIAQDPWIEFFRLGEASSLMVLDRLLQRCIELGKFRRSCGHFDPCNRIDYRFARLCLNHCRGAGGCSASVALNMASWTSASKVQLAGSMKGFGAPSLSLANFSCMLY